MKVVSLLVLVLLSACAKPETNFVSSAVLQPPDPVEIVTKSVEFKVINSSTIGNIDIDSTSWYALDANNYENLAYNMQEILRYLKQQKNVIDYYKEVTSTSIAD